MLADLGAAAAARQPPQRGANCGRNFFPGASERVTKGVTEGGNDSISDWQWLDLDGVVRSEAH